MNLLGHRSGRAAELDRHRPSEQAAPLASRVKTPYWLLWSTGIVAFVLSIIAFLLWGFNGTATLFDMIVALCT
jgi:hypothetical protein